MKWIMMTPAQYVNIDAYDQLIILDNEDRGICDTQEEEWHLLGIKGSDQFIIEIWFNRDQAYNWLEKTMEEVGASQ
jgi:hypothetical protein